MFVADIFKTLYFGSDIIISTFYTLINMPFIKFFDFLQGDIVLTFYTLINDIGVGIAIPNIPIIDIVLDNFFTLLELLFMPLLPFYSHLGIETYTQVPMYICLLSAICNTFIIVSLFKMAFWVLEVFKS